HECRNTPTAQPRVFAETAGSPRVASETNPATPAADETHNPPLATTGPGQNPQVRSRYAPPFGDTAMPLQFHLPPGVRGFRPPTTCPWRAVGSVARRTGSRSAPTRLLPSRPAQLEGPGFESTHVCGRDTRLYLARAYPSFMLRN